MGESRAFYRFSQGANNMKNSAIERAIDLLSGWFLNGIIVALWAMSIAVLVQMDYPAAFQIWPVVMLLGMIALSLPFALVIMLKGGFRHIDRKTVF
jgi:hypothetical protein